MENGARGTVNQAVPSPVLNKPSASPPEAQRPAQSWRRKTILALPVPASILYESDPHIGAETRIISTFYNRIVFGIPGGRI